LGNVETHEFQARQTHQNLILNLLATPQRQTKTTCFDWRSPPYATPGADDNATGGIAELAKFAVEPTTRYPVRLVAFDMEEYGL